MSGAVGGAAGGAVAGVGRTLSGTVLRVVVLLAGASAALAQALGPVPVGAVVLVLAAVTAAALLPRSPAPAAALVGLVVLVVAGGGAVEARDVVTMVGLHACHVAAGLAAAVPPHVRVELAALAPTVRRFAVVQGLALPVAVAASLAGTGSRSLAALVAGGVALAAVAVAVAVLGRRLRAG